jgi:suppressor of ftsI
MPTLSRRLAALRVSRPARRGAAVMVCLLVALGAAAGSLALAQGTSPTAAPAGGAPLREPTVYASYHGVLNITLVASEKTVEVAGQQVLAKVYNGSYAAPTLVIHPGDMVRIKLVDHLLEPTNLHFHGLEISPNGHADNIFVSVNPGHTYEYYFRLPRSAPTGTFWYHSHEMEPASSVWCGVGALSEEQVFDGLSGLIEVQGLRQDLPPALRHVTERYIALKDVQIANGAIISSNISSDAPTTRVVDGQVDPRLTIAPGQTQLWHIANIGADIFYDLHLDGHYFEVIAQDGHPVIHPLKTATLIMPPGKRFDVLVRGGKPGISQLRTLTYNQGDDLYPDTVLASVVTTGRRDPTSAFPTFIAHTPDLRRDRVARRRVVVFSENTAGTRFYIDGQSYDPRRINFHARLNTVESWTIVNHTDEQHPFHMHTYPMQVLSTNGVPSDFDGYQDEVILPPHGYVVLRINFRQYTGVTVFHCHILAHEDAGMMANIEVSL